MGSTWMQEPINCTGHKLFFFLCSHSFLLSLFLNFRYFIPRLLSRINNRYSVIYRRSYIKRICYYLKHSNKWIIVESNFHNENVIIINDRSRKKKTWMYAATYENPIVYHRPWSIYLLLCTFFYTNHCVRVKHFQFNRLAQNRVMENPFLAIHHWIILVVGSFMPSHFTNKCFCRCFPCVPLVVVISALFM